MTNKECKDALGSFSSSQSIYNSWSNKWDLCEYFGPSDDDKDEDSLDVFERHNDPGSRDNKIAHAAYITSCIQGPAPFLPMVPSQLLMLLISPHQHLF